jgi:hypothetical protein
VQADAHTLAVDQMRLGDHAFAHYADDDVRWAVPAVFTQLGLGRGEKVIILQDPAVSHDEAYQRLTAFGGSAEQARDRGQLVFSSMRALIHPDRKFTARRQLSRLREKNADGLFSSRPRGSISATRSGLPVRRVCRGPAAAHRTAPRCSTCASPSPTCPGCGVGLADCGRLAALPDPGASEAGRGLWLVQELSDRLHIGGDLGGAIVTLEFELAGERPGVAAASRGAWLDDAWGPFGK